MYYKKTYILSHYKILTIYILKTNYFIKLCEFFFKDIIKIDFKNNCDYIFKI